MSAITPIVWEARTAHDISAVFNAGDHAISSGVAGQTWGGTAATWAEEIGGHLATAMGKLATGMGGANGTAALVRLTGFAAWVTDIAAQSALLAVAHDIHSASYTAATVTMPSAPEIIAADALTSAGGTLGTAVAVGPEAAAAAQKAMDMQAALTMDAYEVANIATMATPVSFPVPPTIANSNGALDAFFGATGNPVTDAIGNAVQGAQTASATVQSVAGQIQGVAGQIAPAAQVLSSAGSQVVSAASGMSSQAMTALTNPVGDAFGAATSAPANMEMGMSTLPAGGVTGAVSFGSAALPVGWGTGGLSASPLGGTGIGPANTALADAERTMIRPNTGSAAVGQQRRTSDEDEQEHEIPDYLRNFEHFADGRTIAPPVIGMFNEAESGR
jgi:hypothetical protein